MESTNALTDPAAINEPPTLLDTLETTARDPLPSNYQFLAATATGRNMPRRLTYIAA